MEFNIDANTKYADICADIAERQHYDIIERERKKILARGAAREEQRNVHIIRQENEFYEESSKTALQKEKAVQSKIDLEEKLTQELVKRNNESIKDLKMRQQLRETSVELRDLQTKLKNAYICKELMAQIAEKEYLKHMDKLHEKEANATLDAALLTNLEAERRDEQNRIERKADYRKQLQDQMILEFQQKQNMYEDFLKEKKGLDEIIQRINDEDVFVMEQKMYRQKKTQEEINKFKAAQELWRKKERDELEAENKRIIEFMREKERIEEEMKAKKKSDVTEKEEAKTRLGQKVYMENLRRSERQEIIADLLEEEAKEREEKRIKDHIRKQVLKQMEIDFVRTQQIEQKMEKLKREEEEEERFKQRMMDEYMKNKKLDQLSAEKKRLKMIEIRRELQEDIQVRRAKRAEDLRILIQVQETLKQQEENKRKIIEEERLRILKEHASNLIGYLPPGVLRKDDLPLLGSEFVKRYS